MTVILIVEDDVLANEYLEFILQQAGTPGDQGVWLTSLCKLGRGRINARSHASGIVRPIAIKRFLDGTATA